MSISEQLQMLQWKLKSEFPISDLDSANFDANDFLMKCLSGKSGSLFTNAKQLKTDLESFVKNVESSLSKHIHADFDKLLELPGKLYKFEEKIQGIQDNSHDYFQKLSVFLSKVRSKREPLQEAIRSFEEEKRIEQERRTRNLFQQNLQEIEINLPKLRNTSNECLSSPRILTHGALIVRLSKLFVKNIEILSNEYHSQTFQLKSDFLLILSRELIGWSTQRNAFQHFATILKSYGILTLEVEAQLLIREKVLVPYMKEALLQCQTDPESPESLNIGKFYEQVKSELEDGKFKNLNVQNDILIKSYFASVVKVISGISRLFTPGFSQDYITNFRASLEFVNYINHKTQGEFIKSTEYSDFIEKWNLPTYFELRKSDIIKPVCELLKSANLEEFLKGKPDPLYISALQELSQEFTKIPQLQSRLLRLTLQLLSTYVNFIIKHLNIQSKSKGVSVDVLLKLVQSIRNVQTNLPFEGKLLEGANTMLEEVLDPCSRCLGEAVVRQCLANLEAFKTIPASYRMTNRPFPTSPSSFVPSFLLPLKQITIDQANRDRIVNKVAVKFLELLSDLLSGVKKSGDLLSKYTSSKEDQTKMYKQIEIDSQAFLEELGSFGYTAENSEILKQIFIQVDEISTFNPSE